MKIRNITAFKIKQKIYLFWLANFHFSPNKIADIKSDLKIDVVIPTTEKDIVTLPHVIDGVLTNIRHPLGSIFLVSPHSEKIKQICSLKNCIFIDEDAVAPVDKDSIEYTVNGVDRSGWIFQQLLKWSGDKFCNQDYYLTVDSDTILIRPQVFEYNNKLVFNVSDEYHKPYFEIYERLLHEK